MTWIKNMLAKLIGKTVQAETGPRDATSRTKVIAVIAVLIPAIQQLSIAWGHPIVIPDFVLKILAAAGLWTLRDAIKA